MSFTGNESEEITLQEAIDMTTAYRDANPAAVKAHFFGKNQLMKVLNQSTSDLAGIRIYYGIDEDNQKQLVIVGVGYDGKDMTSGVILDRSYPCPNSCDTSSPLY